MSVASIEFLVSLLIGSATFSHLRGRRVRQAAFALGNAGFLWLLVPNLATWAALAVFLLSGYAIAALLRARPRRSVLVAYLVLLVAGFVFLKKYAFLRLIVPAWLLGHPVALVGLSYMLFRQIHFLVDAMQGQVRDPSLWTYLNYQLNLFTLIAGPIQRHQEFAAYWNEPRMLFADRHELLRAVLRVLMGVVKLSVIAAACLSAYDRLAGGFAAAGGGAMGRWAAVGRFAALFYLYPVYVYFNFCGYCDIVIGGAALVGLRLPENFDRPYLARNMIDFWTRWHRTLSFWIRDYLFMPMYKAIAVHWPRRAHSLTFLCYFAALLVAGIWHGSTWNFLVFGLLHGAGVSAAKLWENHILKRRGRSGLRTYMQSRPIRVVAVLGTFHFVCLTFLFFPAELDQCLRVLGGFFRLVT